MSVVNVGRKETTFFRKETTSQERLMNVHLLRCYSQTVTQVSPESGYLHYIETKYTEN